jgi:hypothetical protein
LATIAREMPVFPEVGSRIVEPAVLLGLLDHEERGPVLDRPGRVAVLELGPQPDVVRRGQPRQPYHGRIAEAGEQ